jgi:hypothetical protein
VATKPKAINLSTQSTEKHHKKKSILNIHQVRLLAQFSHVLLEKQWFLAKIILRANVGNKMSDTRFRLKSGSEKQSLFFSLK